ncbi:LPXTG-motif cell wall-anchored protein [Hamadaea flava]|uniref:LPXTG cell wall anchor domain-containing protein n=1 Tax=Hamadaea flava TaxID=1742688 RepID=UPI0020A606F6|nr:LPXTG cell wall anchor domain-containing protein [Hamadaea flava]MCP2324056.1 LPXTG-motif cell wall-anchored protein [Hamadaea flava]
MSAGRFSPYIRRVGVPLVLAVVGTVTLGVGVFAASVKDSQIPTTAKAFKTHQCDGFGTLSDSQDGWHFVVPDKQGDGFTSLTLTFSTSGGTVTAGPITSTDPAAPNTGTGWKGWLDAAGKKQQYKHAYVITTAGWQLTAATADLANEAKDATFNLSHTCPGTPVKPSPSASPSTSPSRSTSPSPEVSESPSASPSASVTESPSPSESPSVSTSPSPEVSESPSTSTSPSPEVSESPSTSPSAEVSESPSASTSPSPEVSESPSPSVTVSESTSPSPKASESTSPVTSPTPSPTTIEMLPTTGSSFSSILIVAGSLLLLGGGLMMVATRRRLVEIE